MATDIVLRSVKAAALTHAEMDQNWESLAQTIDSQTSSYTVLVTDQNKIIEANISSGTITLPTVANAAGTDTDSFRITVKNIHATSLNLVGNGSETIDGAGGITLLTDECITLSLSANAAEWTSIAVHGPNLTGITASSTEINYNDITTLGTAQANKVMTTDGANNFTSTGTVTSTAVNASTTLQIAGVTITSSAAELNYSNNVTSDIQGQLNDRMAKASNLGDVTSAATSRTNIGVDVAGTDNSTNVSLAGTPNYLTIAGQVITRALISLTSHVTGILPIANGGTAASTASGARTNLGVDAAGTDNSTNVTLGAGEGYLSLVGQVLTDNAIDLATNVTGITAIANGGTASSTATGAVTNLGFSATASEVNAICDGKTLTSSDDKIDNFPATTQMLFRTTAAPTGWTKLTTQNDKALRIVSGTVGSGGTQAFTTTFGSGKTTDSHTLLTSEMPAHTHGIKNANNNNGQVVPAHDGGSTTVGTIQSDSTGGGGGHTHPLTNFDLQYVDTIEATKD